MPTTTVGEWLKHHEARYILEAIRITESAGKRHPNYTTAILQRWAREGYPEEAQSAEDAAARKRKVQEIMGTLGDNGVPE